MDYIMFVYINRKLLASTLTLPRINNINNLLASSTKSRILNQYLLPAFITPYVKLGKNSGQRLFRLLFCAHCRVDLYEIIPVVVIVSLYNESALIDLLRYAFFDDCGQRNTPEIALSIIMD